MRPAAPQVGADADGGAEKDLGTGAEYRWYAAVGGPSSAYEQDSWHAADSMQGSNAALAAA
ncbi:hypothetical protein IscW_ISCW021526 [Ixodes scapularis]|uniref:Uncharacterized protein n=1 Tax=Ixodes scapularis TaxID=6945 RepID=B7Q8B0_IXOSC|nr:hypothetical protein IscW_ISCW021526 [Ixodes scapularis]|eukprot:XP_002412332.1 hypothetical protein IscW_ISCW021526 [Ixodes scapularis]